MRITNSQIERIEKILSENSIDPAPDKKIIDLSVCIDGVDMEFSDNGNLWYVDILREIKQDGTYLLKNRHGWERKCRVRKNHWMAHTGAECPIPEGLVVKVKFHTWGGTGESQVARNYKNIDWNLIYQYKVVGPSCNYRYEWEKG